MGPSLKDDDGPLGSLRVKAAIWVQHFINFRRFSNNWATRSQFIQRKFRFPNISLPFTRVIVAQAVTRSAARLRGLFYL
jgi:hypothetical protein